MTFKSRTFAGRMTRRIILVLLVTMAIITWLIVLLATFAMDKESEMRYQGIMNLTNERIEKVLTAVEVAASNNVDEVQRSLSSSDDVLDALEKELKINKLLIGAGVAFKANYYDNQGKWFEPYVARRKEGKMEKVQLGSDKHDYLKSEWFTKVIKENKSYWSDPYFDKDGAKTMLCTYALPVHDQNGQTVGVFAADISLEWLKDQLKDIDKKNNEDVVMDLTKDQSYSFIIGRNGTYIVHPDERRVLNKNFSVYAKNTKDTIDNRLCKNMMEGYQGNIKTDIDGIPSFVFYSPLERAGWSMAIVVPEISMTISGYILAILIGLLMFIGLVVVFLMCRFTIRHATKPLVYLAASTDEVAKGNFDTPLPFIKHNDEIHRLRDSFQEMQHSLSKYVKQLKSTTAQKASLESELNIAHGIQMAMLPKTFNLDPECKEIDIYGSLKPAKAVGGDLYNFSIHDNKLFFCIGDVSGKGVPASLVMAVTNTLFSTMTAQEERPDYIVSALNETLSSRNESGMFVTLFAGVIDLETGLLQYCNAGHNAPLLVVDDDVRQIACDPNLPVAVMTGFDYSLQQMMIPSEAIIFLYTDGLTEAENIRHELFGEERMMEELGNCAKSKGELNAVKYFTDSMTVAVHDFGGDAEQSDDLTMLAIQYTRNNKNISE